MSPRNSTIAGAVLGLLLFVSLGALPAMVYGGYAGVALVGWMFGTPVQVGLASRAVVIFAMGAGVLLSGAMFVVGGAMTGAAIGLLASPPRSGEFPRSPRK